MAQGIRGADAVVEALGRAGVRKLFTLSGNHIMEVFDAAFGRERLELVHVRHEAATVHMADAYARLTGEVGVALVTGGPGQANAVPALFTALAGEVPVVLLSGHAPLAELGLGAFQELRQADLAAPVAKASWTARSAATLADDVARAIRIARSGRPGPVHLALPTDVLEAEFDPAGIAWPEASAFAPERAPLAPETAAFVLDVLARARRPVLVAPPALCTPAGRRAIAALEGTLGLPVAALESPRGLADPSLGAFTEALAEADLVVLLGKQLDFTLRFGRSPAIPADARWIVLDPDPALIGRATALLQGRLVLAAPVDAASAVAALTEAAQRGWPGAGAHSDWAARLSEAIAWRPEEWAGLASLDGGGPVHPATLCHALRPWLDAEESVVVLDGGEVGQWAQSMLSDAASARIVNGVAGAIGASIPFAAGASAARPGARVMAVLGDGSFGFHMAEFDTAARNGLPFVAVIGNDGRWNAEYQIQVRDYGANRAHGCEMAPGTRYDLAVAALGGHGEYVTSAAELPAALERAFASGRPACVNVLLDGRAAPVLRRRG